MVNMSSTTDVVPKFAHGLKILLVDHDANYLTYTASVLSQYSFNVAAIQEASKALSLINDQKNNNYELAMANFNISDRDSLSFLHALFDMDIPIILMSSVLTDNLKRKAVDKGVKFFLQKPIPLEELKKVWQLVYRNGKNQIKDIGNDSSEDRIDSLTSSLEIHEEDLHNQNAAGKKHSADDNIGQGKIKRVKSNVEKSIPVNRGNDQEGIVKRSNEKNKKKRRIVWTPELHYRFTSAISYLGDEKARPKAILKVMGVKGTTMRQIGSHLQKYKNQVMRIYLNTGIFTRRTSFSWSQGSTSKLGGQGRQTASTSFNNHANNKMLNGFSSHVRSSRYGNHNDSIRTDGWFQHKKPMHETSNVAYINELMKQLGGSDESNLKATANPADVTQEQVFFSEFEDPFLMNSPNMNYKTSEDTTALNQEKNYYASSNFTTSETVNSFPTEYEGEKEVADFLLDSPSEENTTDAVLLLKEPLDMIKLDQPCNQTENKLSAAEIPTETTLLDATNLSQKSLESLAISSNENDAEYVELLKKLEAEAECNAIGNAPYAGNIHDHFQWIVENSYAKFQIQM